MAMDKKILSGVILIVMASVAIPIAVDEIDTLDNGTVKTVLKLSPIFLAFGLLYYVYNSNDAR